MKTNVEQGYHLEKVTIASSIGRGKKFWQAGAWRCIQRKTNRKSAVLAGEDIGGGRKEEADRWILKKNRKTLEKLKGPRPLHTRVRRLDKGKKGGGPKSSRRYSGGRKATRPTAKTEKRLKKNEVHRSKKNEFESNLSHNPGDGSGRL